MDTSYRITLQQLLKRISLDLTDAEHFQFIGTKRIFTEEEAISIINDVKESRAKINAEFMSNWTPSSSTETEHAKRAYKQREKPTLHTVPQQPVINRCTAISNSPLRKTCGNALEGNGVGDSGFCDNCWYPSIVDDYSEYRKLRKQGLGREAAALQIGLPFTEETDPTRHIVKAPVLNRSAAWAGSNKPVDKFPVVQFIELVKAQEPATPDEILTAMDNDTNSHIQRDSLMTNEEMVSVDNDKISTCIEN